MPADLDRLKEVLGDRYTIDRELGRGGMATVYLAEDLKHHRQVAIKVLHPELSVTLGAERFLREIETTAGLNHPYILPLHDSGQADGFLYYVMPYVKGESLGDRLKREGPLPVDDALRISREVAAALSHAHEQGVLHRDIKPENILLSAGEAVVADFGIARAVDEAGGEQLTATGMSMGSPSYMSPEQATGEEELDERTDLYALGCVLYEMLTGEPPLVDSSPRAVMARKVSEPAPGLRNKREGVSEELEAVVLKALARAPESRYETASEFDQALTAGLPRARWVREGRRSRARTLSLAAVAVVLVAAVIYALTSPFGAGAAERPVAIIPFEHRTPEAEDGEPSDAWFAEALAEQIFATLGYVDVVTGIEEDREKEPDQVRRDLGVRSYVVGSVTQIDNQVRVNIRIFDARSGSQLWAKVFDRGLSDIFDVQSEIADSVVTQLVDHGIVPSERERLLRIGRPTENQEAHLAYLTGKAPGGGGGEHFARAVELDPEFTWAWAELSVYHVDVIWFNIDRSEERHLRAKDALNQALALAPDDPTVLRAQAYYLDVVERDYDQALALYSRVAEAEPNNFDVEQTWASCYRRAGRWGEAVGHFLRAIELNPTNMNFYRELAITYMGLRQYDKALENMNYATSRGGSFARKPKLFWAMGQLDSARTTLEESDRRFGPPQVGNDPAIGPLNWFWQEYYEGRFEEAIRRLEAWEDSTLFHPGYLGPKRLYIGLAYQALGQLDAAIQQYDSARVMLEARLNVPEVRNAAYTHSDLGIAYALLGRPQEAIAAGQRAVEMHANDHFWGPREIGKLAFIHTILGNYNAALDLIEQLLSTDAGHYMSVPLLKLDQRWAPLRNQPRYGEIIEKYEG